MSFPWFDVVEEAVERWDTPFYLAAWAPVRIAYDELRPLSQLSVPVRHWYSVKTQPLKPLLIAWREQFGAGAEVVSLVELLAANAAGFTPENILVNGLAKHSWLPAEAAGLRIHIDSVREFETLGPERLRPHRVGIRCHVATEHDPDDATVGGQFGVLESELARIADLSRVSGLPIEGVHFHLRSNVRDPDTYARAVEQVLSTTEAVGIVPRYVDCGGGFPVPDEVTNENGQQTSTALPLPELVSKLQPLLARYRSVEEVWFENGRFLTSRGAVLVLRVVDVKDRPDCRYVLCDGGRTNHALPADWQPNSLTSIPARNGPEILTAVCGPTCTAYDRFSLRMLPQDLTVGDYIIWFNAGAYHLSWETRFSQGLAKVIWCDDEMRLTLARPGEDFSAWWGSWS